MRTVNKKLKINNNSKWWHWLERENIPVIYCNLRDSGHPFDPRFKKIAKTFGN